MTTFTHTREEAIQISETIMEQLTNGGHAGRLIAMIGAHSFTFSNKGETAFQFKMCRKANHFRIELTDADLYTITFSKYSKKAGTLTQVKVYEEVYGDTLSEIFTSFTGLDTHL